MTTNARRPGRPRGTGKKDGADLDAVADLLVSKPSMRKTPAIAQVVQNRHPDRSHEWAAIERRLLRKWGESGEERMKAAQARHHEREEERRARAYRPAASHGAADLASAALAPLGYGSAFTRSIDSVSAGALAALGLGHESGITRALDSMSATGLAAWRNNDVAAAGLTHVTGLGPLTYQRALEEAQGVAARFATASQSGLLQDLEAAAERAERLMGLPGMRALLDRY
jgi:hypothetical protein